MVTFRWPNSGTHTHTHERAYERFDLMPSTSAQRRSRQVWAEFFAWANYTKRTHKEIAHIAICLRFRTGAVRDFTVHTVERNPQTKVYAAATIPTRNDLRLANHAHARTHTTQTNLSKSRTVLNTHIHVCVHKVERARVWTATDAS